MTPGEILREARLRHEVSQRELAIRAGTTQSAISRIEKDRVSPSVATLRELLYLLGEELVLGVEPRDSGVDATLNRGSLEFTSDQRLTRTLQFADLVSEIREESDARGLRRSMDQDIAPPLLAPDLLQTLVRNGVDFVVIGGVAGSIQGSAYPTYDLDVAYSREQSNLVRMAAALKEMEVSLRGAPEDLPFQVDATTLANGANFTFDSKFGRFDILSEIDGVRDYESLRSASRIEEIGGVAIRVASIDHLIAMKRAANRTKDKLMLEEYIVIADEQKKLAREKKEAGEG